MTPSLETELTKLEKSLLKAGRQDFVEEVRKLSAVALDARLTGLAKHREEILTTKANDEEFQAVAQKKKDLEAVYREQTSMNKKLSRFIHLIMKEQGLD